MLSVIAKLLKMNFAMSPSADRCSWETPPSTTWVSPFLNVICNVNSLINSTRYTCYGQVEFLMPQDRGSGSSVCNKTVHSDIMVCQDRA